MEAGNRGMGLRGRRALKSDDLAICASPSRLLKNQLRSRNLVA